MLIVRRGPQVPEQAQHFWPTTKRLIAYLRPWRVGVIVSILLAVISVILSILAPKILGEATTIIYDGMLKGYAEMKAGAHLSTLPINFTRIWQIGITVILLYLFLQTLLYHNFGAVPPSRENRSRRRSPDAASRAPHPHTPVYSEAHVPLCSLLLSHNQMLNFPFLHTLNSLYLYLYFNTFTAINQVLFCTFGHALYKCKHSFPYFMQNV